ncbi:cell wall metabolism sensor histidine kinase WalK [Fredinandcohnia sp. QZ13]|uniref:cell wall metabolism sensor histidine kinase WalK n=1 Tax=Fredinandcohnia sp. QZ13 TaxID=3073144 RepID=UPI0028530922|nr:cell wall metabolism sensor histidine kinase WalK [Fredinandcohnia sp. QZ13]MDR4890472.1 cell wall metabolism sensor histidine kinase WalK [Fredinandcohnia sp. QZ13]
MRRLGFFQSIHIKFALIYLLLILIAMQIIGVYFIGKLELRLVENFKVSLNERVNMLAFSMEQEMIKEREDPTTLEKDIRSILRDYESEDIQEIQVIDNKSRVIGTSDPYSQGVVGRKSNIDLVKRTLLLGDNLDDVRRQEYDRVYISSTPIRSNGDIIGAIYLKARLENVYDDIKEINDIFVTGTGIAMAITAILGIFVAQTITRPISAMRKHVVELGKGNYSKKVKVFGQDEIGQLAMTFNNLSSKIQDAQATTEGERRKLSSVLAHMTDGVIATDKKGRVILINTPAVNMLDVSRETVLNESIVSVLGLDEQYTFEELVHDIDTEILDFSTHKKQYIIKVSFSVIKKESGFINGLIAVLYDVTEQEKIESERREFVANVSHELRTPLTTMRSYLEALAEGAWKDEKIAPQFLNVTQTETERMIRLVNDLLKLSKLDSKDYKFSKELINFTKYFHRIIDRFEMSKEQHVSFVRNLPEKSIYLEFDPDKITQVLDNVISNALKYSPEGGTVTFQLMEVNDEIVISVADQGVGIPKDNINRIFDRFYRVDKARTRKLGGTGLGLAIAKEMVVAHGGRIWAESEEGVGTTVFFTLPTDGNQEGLEDEWDEV